MGKIAIMTINSLNFGNRLQNYALQKVIESFGHSVETIRRNNYIWDETSLSNKLKDEARVLCKTRKGLYLSFDRRYIKFSQFYATPNTIDPLVVDKYDYFVVGSDQVWNPFFDYLVGKCDLLSFAPNSKRVAYAASFGVDSIPSECQQLYSEELMKFHALSAREQAGVRLVEKLANVEAKLVLDPTLLLTADEWNRIAKKPANVPKRKYVLVYIIGKISPKVEQEISEAKEEHDLEEVNVLKKNANGREPAIGPAEFIWLIQHAEMVITDSFHASVFSLLFRTRVCTHKRDGINMSSRIRCLAEISGLTDRFDSEDVFRTNEKEDYSSVFRRINVAKEESMLFLETALTT